MRRLLCLCLAALCLLGSVGCAADEPVSSAPESVPVTSVPEQSGPKTFAVAFSHDDTLNPFAAKTEANLRLATLLYDSLTVTDEVFGVRFSLAASVTRSDATHLVVTLRERVAFSDGSAVTVEDVAASFKLARASKNYQALLSNVTAAKGNKKTRQITFTLASPDPHAEACLTFPVIKASTATTEAAKAPVGGGVYTLQTTEDGAVLAYNPRSGKKPHYETISLRHLPNSDTMYYGLASGDITYYFNDLNTGEIPRVSGANVAVDMNVLLYLGINTWKGVLAQPSVRQALSLLLDRPVITSSAYGGWAKASQLPLHPAWQPVTELKLAAPARDLDGALERLTAAGYGNAAEGKKLELELLYSTGSAVRGAAAELIRSQMEGAGVQITLVPLAYTEYIARLKTGKYDLYLGEIRLAANMDLRPQLAAGAASFGVQPQGVAATAYAQYRQGEITLEAFLQAFDQDLPYIPVCWRCGVAAYDRRLTTVTPTGQDAYYGIAAWK